MVRKRSTREKASAEMLKLSIGFNPAGRDYLRNVEGKERERKCRACSQKVR